MDSSEGRDNGQDFQLSDRFLQSIQDQVAKTVREQLQTIRGFQRPLLQFEARIQDAEEDPETPRPTQRIAIGSMDLSVALNSALTSPITTNGAEGPLLEVATASRRLRTRHKPRRSSHDGEDGDAKRRKTVAGLRLAPVGSSNSDGASTDSPTPTRQLVSNERNFPQRKKPEAKSRLMQPSSLDRLIIGIWEQIHGSISFDPQVMIDQWQDPRLLEDAQQMSEPSGVNATRLLDPSSSSFNRINLLCRKVSQASRCFRALEVIVQAHWIQCYDEHVQVLAETNSHRPLSKSRKATLMEACKDFGWSEKDLRNKMAIWRGYHEIKQAAGWVALVFAGMGIYRFCKYRVGFSDDAMLRLRGLRSRFEVAADTLHPQWRQLLSAINQPTERAYQGHPHDWVVTDSQNPIPLHRTYLQWDPHFNYEHLDESIIDQDAWGFTDPRSITIDGPTPPYICGRCSETQSDDPKENNCRCFPNLYGGKRVPCPVQVFRTSNGRNNGLLACCPFERGVAIAEFIGLITKDLQNLDVMQGETDHTTYQIWQGRQGNYTRFVNHSCQPNSQFERFIWLGCQRIVLVSKGIEAGNEITVDYSWRYWTNLDKVCLCGASNCRYSKRAQVIARDEEMES